jgi:hypothetical protein
MSASATLTIPVTFVTSSAKDKALGVLLATAGASAIAVDGSAGTATLGYEFPGNVDGLVRRLNAVGAKTGPTVKVSVPVKNLSGKIVDPTHLLADLNASPAVSDAGYDGNTVTATIALATNAFRYVYEEIIIAGLMPLDMPTIAHPQEFVL